MPRFPRFSAVRLVMSGVALLAALGASADTAAVWAHPAYDDPGRYARIEMAPVEGRAWDQALDLSGAVISSVVHPNTVVHMRLLDTTRRVQAQGAIELPLEVGRNSFTFSILPEAVPSGLYEAHFVAIGGEFQLLAEATMTVRKLDGRHLRQQVDAAASQAAALRAHLAAHGGAHRFPYEVMRITAVDQLLPASRRLLDGHALLQADETLRYMNETLDSVRATLTFGDPAELEAGGAPRPDMTTVSPRDGAFYAGNQPIFLMGFAGGGQLARDLELFSRLGLNFALTTLGPEAGAPGFHPASLEPIIEQARRHNVAVSVRLSTSPEANFPQGAEFLPQQFTVWPEAAGIRPSPLDAFRADAMDWLGRQAIVRSVGVASRPVFHFRGEEARLAYIDTLRHAYPTQFDLNRSWKMRLREFDEVEITPDSDRIAYQHDWRRFSRAMGVTYAGGQIEQLQASAPRLPLYLQFDGNMFGQDEVPSNLDYAGLGAHTAITAVGSRLSRAHPRYAMDYPGFVLPYVLLRSIVPNQPLLDTELHLDLEGENPHAPSSSEDFVHAGIWDAAIEGLNGAALWAWTRDAGALEATPGNLIDELGALEGLARVSLDLNRTADIVVAFQQAPADVAILYSHESLIRPESGEYRESLRAAYEGVSFGGRKAGFVTERQVAEGALDGVRVLVLPKVRALPDEAFAAVSNYIEQGGIVIRTPNQIPYDGRGHSRPAVIVSTLQTVLVRGLDTPTAYFHAIEAAWATGLLPDVPRPSNEFGYLLEGVKSRFVEVDGQAYLYLVNLRQQPVRCGLSGVYSGGYDLIQGRPVRFPAVLSPLDPMLIRLDAAASNRVVIAVGEPATP
jgi:hypothetical protein